MSKVALATDTVEQPTLGALPRTTLRTMPSSQNSLATHTPPLVPEALRGAIAVCLLGIGLIHTLDLPSKWHETPYLAVAYGLLVGASLRTATGVLSSDSRLWSSFAAMVAAAPILGYTVSRTVGLPASTGDIGNWLEPLGLASLFVEITVLLFTALTFASRKK